MPEPGLPHIMTMSRGFFLSMTIGAEDNPVSRYTATHCFAVGILLVSVEVLNVAFRKSFGSSVLVNGNGCSLRKYSSGVLKSICAFVAKSLMHPQQGRLCKCDKDHLSEHEWSAFPLVLAGRPPASPIKNEDVKSGPSPSSRSRSSSSSAHMPFLGFLYRSRAVAARRVAGKSKLLKTAVTLALNVARLLWSLFAVLGLLLRLTLP